MDGGGVPAQRRRVISLIVSLAIMTMLLSLEDPPAGGSGGTLPPRVDAVRDV